MYFNGEYTGIIIKEGNTFFFDTKDDYQTKQKNYSNIDVLKCELITHYQHTNQ